ncbi:dGTP triphosphohydrolase [Geoglobus ahangari]
MDDTINETLKKRLIKEEDYGDSRPPYLRDRDRILFSRAFRRLAFKTQVVMASGRITSDHIRSRLTHSLEVMQIGTSIALKVNEELKQKGRKEKLDLNLVQAIALGHDLGHTPYGHVGEEALFKFMFGKPTDPDGIDVSDNPEIISCVKDLRKIKHCFQSLKVCCFLEKQYKPDFYGLNLTVATLDGIFKHSNMRKKERKLYKIIFDSYFEIYHKNNGNIKIDKEAKNKLTKWLFDYLSPITCEGLIVAIADEIAQLCHDVEDIRRIDKANGIEVVKRYYKEDVLEGLGNILDCISDENAKKVYTEFKECVQEWKAEKIAKIERLYVKLMLTICIPIVSKVILKLLEMGKRERLALLKDRYLGKFDKLEESKEDLGLNEAEAKILSKLDEIFKSYQDHLLELPEVARWDIKGGDLCLDLSKVLFKAFTHKYNSEKEMEVNFNIVPQELRGDLKKSYEAGKDFLEQIKKDKEFKELGELKTLPIRFAVWDYIAGMTDNFIIKEYESLTFKKVGPS